ncbi:FmdB family transcriptional regulator [Agromyces atrinae]|uniref:FmdB family transcriptional regulator n=1 Tax=Agromyces atrinae TaxID=592376 RepID=A0A4Q2M709_9MICO|nr:FmdB family zinc ribbon protein [Agromyces atrinae]RXZ86063.1 FmdB family transcriptional regulator [Agromyces atrinae]
MPTYSYRCTECDNAFDIHQAFSDDSLTVCDVCGGKLRKVFSAIGVTFNGSGFYRTDSRSTSSSTDAASTSSGASTTSSGSGSSDSGSSSGSGSSSSSSSGSGSTPSKSASSSSSVTKTN